MAASTTKRKAPKRTAPRKTAAARAQSNGHEDSQNGTPVAEGFNAQPLSVVPPVQEPAVPEIQHPYGDRPVFVFQPADGSAPIVFPRIGTLEVTAKFMWRIYDLNELFQSFEWMNLAGVPRAIQERVIDLPQVDRARFWSSWFNDVTQPLDLTKDTMGPPGESSS
jgi:hypothetical protein